MKTSELIDIGLDYAVALAEGVPSSRIIISSYGSLFGGGWGRYFPSTGTAGDDIIDRECITTRWMGDIDGFEPLWIAHMPYPAGKFERTGSGGPTRRIAAMRAYVTSKLGDDVEIPEGIQ